MAQTSDKVEEALKLYLSVQNVIVKPIATLSFMFLLYGLYTITFGLCVHILLHRKRSGSGLYFGCIISLFVFATLYVAMKTFGSTREAVVFFHAAKTREFDSVFKYLLSDRGQIACLNIGGFILAIMNVINDVMIIHRCYIIWDFNKTLLYALGAGAFILNAISFATSVMGAISIGNISMLQVTATALRIDMGNSIAMAAFNGLLSVLTAGRIWWISREARQHMGMPIRERYKVFVAAILESGALYPITLIASRVVVMALGEDARALRFPLDLTAIAVLMAGVAPTLIIVRVAYGQSVDSVQQMVSMQFAERASQQASGPTDTTDMRYTINLRTSRHQHDNLEVAVDIPKPEAKASEQSLV